MERNVKLTSHSREALARVWMADRAAVELKVDGRSLDPLLRRNLIYRRPDAPPYIRGKAEDYALTAKGGIVCREQKDMQAEIERQLILQRDVERRAWEEAAKEVGRRRERLAGVERLAQALGLF